MCDNTISPNDAPRCLLVYSSVTGNTKAVAEAIREVLPEDSVVVPVQKAPPPENFDCVILGFWAYKAGPDPLARRYMETVRGKKVAFFGTLAAWPDSPHAKLVVAAAEELLQGNTILGSFLCQGKLSPKRLEQRLNNPESGRHPMTPERRARLLEAANHPNERDFAMAQETFRELMSRAAARARRKK